MTSERADQMRKALGELTSGLANGEAPWVPDEEDPWALSLAAFTSSWRLEHAAATDYAERAIEALPAARETDADVVVLAYAVRVLASAGTGLKGEWADIAPGLTPSGDPLVDAQPLLGAVEGSTATARFARYALAEAALACGRISIAERVDDIAGNRDFLGGHAFSTVMTVLAARIAAFGGRIDEARALLDTLPADGPPRLGMLVAATRSLIDGNAAAPGVVRGLAAQIEDGTRGLDDRLELGCVLLCAYGLVAIGDVRRAANLVSAFDMSRAMVIDRVLALELVVAAAEMEGDRDAAEAVLAIAEALADDPIALSTLDRIRGRVALLAGTPDTALLAAERAVERADDEGRAIEAAEGRIVSARARLASGNRGEATRALESAAEIADTSGHRAFRRAAGRELQGTGRRLRPTPGSGSAGLSDREREVLALVLAGYDNGEIAADLHISTHTARSHVSRVLVAHGVSTRAALAAQVVAASDEPRSAGAASAALDELTTRQRQVVAEVATGASNAEIAERLGITVRTVEKHVNEAMRRWRVGSRVELVTRAAGISLGAPPEK